MRGRMKTLYQVNCALCNFYTSYSPSFGGKKEATAHFRGEGWSLTRAHGWICPYCKKKKSLRNQTPPFPRKPRKLQDIS
jgi:hypothetical protein